MAATPAASSMSQVLPGGWTRVSLISFFPLPQRGGKQGAVAYFVGIRPFTFSMSLMFILKPPGITMSPAVWSGLQAPSHLASSVVLVSRGAPAGGFSLCYVTLTA
jgi:hypothetical protein